ncbi:MAG: hypothetical protein J5966_00135, partial [Lachnospiraceae bacterium]|nr:hypothetical protein [Lachnospiraceae bacterium]
MGNLFDQNQTLKENEVFRTKGKDTAGAFLNRDLKQPTGQKTPENYGNARQQAEPDGMMKEAFGNNVEMTAQLVKDMKAERKSWAGVRGKDGKFVQRYPGAPNVIKAQKAEMTELFELQRVCPGADVNTCREYNALKAYIEKNPEGWIAGAPSQMEGDYKENLTAYTGSLLRYKLTAECLTDEYLSGNITRIYDYAKKLTRYKRTMEQYPDFFYSMPEAMRVVLERKSALGEELEVLLDMHLKLHYINVHTGGPDGNTASLIYNKMSDEEEAQKRAEYKKKLNRFAKRAFAGNEIELAKAFITIAEGEAIYKDGEVTAEEPVSKEGTDKIRTELKAERVQTGNIFLKELREKFASKDADTARLFGPYVNIALDEIGNILHLRDKIIKLQKENLTPGRNSGVKGGEIKKAIKLNNERLLLYTDHIDRYREYLYFLNGDIDMLRKETAEFLKRADHEELLEPVKF